MKMNSGENHLLFQVKKRKHMWAKIGDDTKWESITVKLLTIKIDNELKYECIMCAWMFHSRNTNDKINKLHEMNLMLVNDDYTSTFDKLLEKNVIIINRHYEKSYIKFTFSVIYLSEMRIFINCIHYRLLLFCKFKLFKRLILIFWT